MIPCDPCADRADIRGALNDADSVGLIREAVDELQGVDVGLLMVMVSLSPVLNEGVIWSCCGNAFCGLWDDGRANRSKK
jgi:hypothetical protein